MHKSLISNLLKDIKIIGGNFKGVKSIILVGSASRNELRMINGHITSDFEFVFFTKRFFFNKRIVQKKISEISIKYNIQIDVSFMHGHDSMIFPNRLFFYDLIATGKLIYGKDLTQNTDPLKAKDIIQEDSYNIVYYRILDILNNSSIDSISPMAIIKNMSYIYLFVLIEEGYLEKNFKLRFKRIESLQGKQRKYLTNEFFKDLGPDYRVVKKFRLNEDTNKFLNENIEDLFNKLILVINYCENKMKLSIKYNLIFCLRFIKICIKDPKLFSYSNILISRNPRKKLLVILKSELLKRFNVHNSHRDINFYDSNFFQSIYNENIL